MQKLGRLTVLLRLFETEVSSWTVLVSTILITTDVPLRYIFRKSVPGGLELNCVLLAIMVFFSLGQVQANKEHIRVDFFIDRLPLKLREYLEIAVHLFALAFFSLLFVESIEFFKESLAVKEYYGSAVRIPIYPAKAAVVMGCGLIVIELIKDIAQLVTQIYLKSISGESKKPKESDILVD